jgi:hypothetical protein
MAEIPELHDGEDDALNKAIDDARARYTAQLSALAIAVEHDRLGAIGLVGVDVDGTIIVNFITVHPVMTKNVWMGLSALLGKVEDRMRADGTWDAETELDDEDDDLSEGPDAAPPKLQ